MIGVDKCSASSTEFSANLEVQLYVLIYEVIGKVAYANITPNLGHYITSRGQVKRGG